MSNYINKIYDEICNCSKIWFGEITEININKNTKLFLTKKLNEEKTIYESLTPKIESIMGLKIVENDNLKDGEFVIVLDHWESSEPYGFLSVYEKIYKFKID